MRLRRLARLSIPERYAYVVLALLSLVTSGLTYVAATGYYRAEVAAQARQAAAQRASQQRQGQVLEQRLCTTLTRLAALAPPADTPGNPSRTYLGQQHQVLAELGPDVGCPPRR